MAVVEMTSLPRSELVFYVPRSRIGHKFYYDLLCRRLSRNTGQWVGESLVIATMLMEALGSLLEEPEDTRPTVSLRTKLSYMRERKQVLSFWRSLSERKSKEAGLVWKFEDDIWYVKYAAESK